MKNNGFVFAALAFAVFAAAGSAAAQGLCVQNFRSSYNCAFRTEFNQVVPFCLSFAGGSFSNDFDAYIFDSDEFLPFGCDCKPVGTYNSPQFDNGRQFHCAGVVGSAAGGLAFIGRAKADGTLRGSTVAQNGTVALIVCGGPCGAQSRAGEGDEGSASLLELLNAGD